MSSETLKAKKGCWTCKGTYAHPTYTPKRAQQGQLTQTLMIDRKIRCDRGTPTCQNCVRARKQCQGYGLRLSWPGINDRKRAVRGHLPAVRSQANHELNHRLFINTSWWDIEFFRHITSNGTTPFPLLAQPAQPLWIHPQPGLKQTDLVHYCECSQVTFIGKELKQEVRGLTMYSISPQCRPSVTSHLQLQDPIDSRCAYSYGTRQ